MTVIAARRLVSRGLGEEGSGGSAAEQAGEQGRAEQTGGVDHVVSLNGLARRDDAQAYHQQTTGLLSDGQNAGRKL